MELKLLFCIILVILNRTNASDIENLEKRIVDLEQYIQTLEANLVKK